MNPYEPPGNGPPGYGAPAAGAMGRLEVKTSFFFMMWILFLVTPLIEINGQPNKRAWGTHVFDLPAGRYTIQVSFPYLMKPKTGPAQMQVDIHPGQVTRIEYRAPWLMFLSGTLKQTGTPPMLPP